MLVALRVIPKTDAELFVSCQYPVRLMTRESLINSESFSCAGKMRQIKAPIAGNSQSIAKIGNEELVHFNKQMLIHELIRGSLN
jgi:hypothetical protein